MAVAAEAHPNWFLQPRKVTVDMFNALPNGASFKIHCKSGDDDLGLHVIGPNEKYQLRFKPNFWGTTLFFCGMSWAGGHKVFDIYRYYRDFMDRCQGYCRWQATKDVILGFRQNRPDPDINIPWEK
ncbi:hypothetical protein CDL15_Pgr003562 [Punica granatum]|uniref:S-protein homolog n=1 Tax=Punica granatum TaxID=22663 RepID=A0A218X3V0_PUNGR|nr:hypothetical protein CDL15_Pgr003562 [Punica granatum]